MPDPHTNPIINFLNGFLNIFNHSFVSDNARILLAISLLFNFSSIGSLLIPEQWKRKIQVAIPNSFNKANFDEKIINMEEVCDEEYMKDWGMRDLERRYEDAGEILPEPFKITDGDIIADTTKNRLDIWPVYRWKCQYKSGIHRSANLGLDLERYCKETWGEQYSFGYTNHLDDKSFVCTLDDNEVNHLQKDCSSCENINKIKEKEPLHRFV